MFALEFPFPDREDHPTQAETLNQTSVEASALLKYYGFDLSDQTSEQIAAEWLEQYEASWVFLAILEALYQGRYKAISVQQILIYWQRRGQAIYHFTSDFERLICHRFPQNLLLRSQNSESLPTQETQEKTIEKDIKPEINSELETHETDKLSLKHPDFYRKLKGFMGDKTQEKKKD
ncbi:hypothetical protein [Planktothrix mougeotii]|uniref:DnaD domain-containing protein n=1 Tax=Planktothrix mougeotii LEGE 06226 TaxID=1828728 RepID=A0ABR9UJS8_9CYAN|nr:hypothetical protein [Planktothrix mougeotii]MBE9146721.1 hypothetical protein [Planktothrix mougeotii LEGE 06226]